MPFYEFIKHLSRPPSTPASEQEKTETLNELRTPARSLTGPELLTMALAEFSVEDLSVRALTALARRKPGCMYVGDVVQLSREEVAGTRQLGERSLNQLEALLHRHGLQFSMKLDAETLEQLAALPRSKTSVIPGKQRPH